MISESILQRLCASLAPKSSAKKQIKNRVLTRIGHTSVLKTVSKTVEPSSALKKQVWNRIASSIQPAHSNVLEKVRDAITPSAELKMYVQGKVWQRLQPLVETQPSLSRTKWFTAFTMFAFIMTLSPSLMLAPPILADTQVLLVPTRGEVSFYKEGVWHPVTSETELQSGMRIQTQDGEATIVYRDDALIRLNENSIVAIHDVDEHAGVAPEIFPSASLLSGHIWVQGLMPSTSRGMTVATSNGYTTVHEGSLSIKDKEDAVEIAVWDRNALVSRGDTTVRLLVGERIDMRSNNVLLVKNIAAESFSSDWANKNLSKDAVHQRYIAHLQHERLVSLAGTLPTSSFYPVKRLAEKVDVLLTFDEQTKVEKQLAQAKTRLNEAAALMAEGDLEIMDDSIAEFRSTLKGLASGTGSDSIAQFLIKQSLVEANAGIAAAQPGDNGYLIKKAVLMASADLPQDIFTEDDVEMSFFMDSIDVMIESVKVGNTEVIEDSWQDVQQALVLLENEESTLSPDVKKEAKALLEQLATLVDKTESVAVDDLSNELFDDITAYKPPVETVETQRVVLSDEQVNTAVASMLDRIYVFGMPQSRSNQLRIELSAISGHPEEGRFLRALYQDLPERSRMSDVVRKEIVRLRWQKASEGVVVESTTDVVQPEVL